jgi:CheY-like chemotaxis protein
MRRGRILIAEDEEEWLNPLADACRADGYDVLVATNGRDALTQAQNNHLDAVVLDIMMPELNGYEVCEKLREAPTTADMPIVILSNLSEREHFRRIARLKVDYQVKPIDVLKTGDLDQLLERLWAEIVNYRLQSVTHIVASMRYGGGQAHYEFTGRMTASGGPLPTGLRDQTLRRKLERIANHLFAHHDTWRKAYASDRTIDGPWHEAYQLRNLWRDDAVEVGQTTYNELLAKHPDLMRAWGQAQLQVDRVEHRLALRFNGDRDSLKMPFELLHEGSRPLAIRHPISRQVDGNATTRPSWRAFLANRRGQTIQALLLAGADFAIPEVQSVAVKLQAALERVDVRVLIKPDDLTRPVTLAEAEALLRQGPYHLIHFAGHSTVDKQRPEESYLQFADAGGLRATRLEGFLRNLPVQLMYLSSCLGGHLHTDDADSANSSRGLIDAVLHAGVPAVLGFRWEVVSYSARLFADHFYDGLTYYPASLEHAVWWARRQIFESNPNGGWDETWFSPVFVEQNPS